MRFLALFVYFHNSFKNLKKVFKMFNVIGIPAFDYFFSIFIWFMVLSLPICAALTLLTKRFF